MVPIPEAALLKACRTLFGAHLDLSREFLSYLQPGGVKSAYRRKAKEHHPDLHPGTSHHHHGEDAGTLFREATEAYKLLNRFCRHREERAEVSPPATPTPHQDDHLTPLYHRGPLPARPLEIGRYLYYSGVIPYHALLEAVSWQRRQRPAIGKIAREWGWLNNDAIIGILRNGEYQGRFGEKAVRMGLLQPIQLKAILAYQQSRQTRLGQYFVEKGHLSRHDLERLVREMHVHNARVRNSPSA